jgi:DNA topoisomerase-1
MKLVIVESPSKAKTINKYLGKEYSVMSSIGHIRDLPKSNKNAIDIHEGFVPHYEISKGKGSVVKKLVDAAKKADEIILAADPDREGEAIAWHLAEIFRDQLGKTVNEKLKRVTFNSITKTTVLDAMEHPRTIDNNLRRAQEARRVLDRIVGYDLSGLIWKKVRYGLSAGRVQSPALRILMEREREIRAFEPDDYYVLQALMSAGKEKLTFVCDTEPDTQDEAERIQTIGQASDWHIVKIKETQQQRKPRAPFTTSTLQQTASTRLGMSPSRTMRAAQKLYEAGMITYMRTDSTSLSKEALAKTAKAVEKHFGNDYVEVKNFATKNKNAQEAHEAIRPTDPSRQTAGITGDQKSLYSLIWKRTLASQMKPAQMIKTKISANITEGEDIPHFSINGSRTIYDGWLACDPGARGEDVELPQLSEGDTLDLQEITLEQKFTQPPHRYSEAGLIKELEKREIGRPSTYASIISTIVNRGYVDREGRTLFPTDTGDVVSSFLEEHFGDYIGDDFTAQMENELDEIARGDAEYVSVLASFYTPFHDHVESKEDIPKLTNLGDADPKFKCPTCGASMVIKLGRSGKFLSCSRYPECDGALTLEGKEVGVGTEPLGQHPESGENIYVLEGRFGPYVQLGESAVIPKLTKYPKGHKKTPEEKEKMKQEKEAIAAAKALPKPKRASLPKNKKVENLTLDEAVHLLILPRTLGQHPETGTDIITNIGRFGPYVGHGKEFRSIKKTTGLDPYTITLDEALKILNEPKALPKGTELVRELGKHPKTGKDLRILKSKSGMFIQKGMKRIYLPDNADPEKLTMDEVVALMSVS